jgi:hypothetical protein
VKLYRTNWDGLTVGDTIKQSILIHPDWSVQDHRSYLLSETTFRYQDLGLNALGEPNAADIPDEQCAYPAGCPNEQMPSTRLCLEHFVNVGRLFAPAPGHSW